MGLVDTIKGEGGEEMLVRKTDCCCCCCWGCNEVEREEVKGKERRDATISSEELYPPLSN